MTQKTANLIILSSLVLTSLLVLAAFIYVFLTPDYENRENILIGTAIGFVSGSALSLYIWFNRNNLHLR